ncbi:hypothetical protein [Amycolatopsis thermoflava]|uniref:hypothetical protein n=1 Tax=Amycolatopsis thermoflava TaxID=84480 RepID=UPI003EB87095
MHEFARDAAPSGADEIDLVRRSPFALLVTPSDGAPVATHLPVVFPARLGRRGAAGALPSDVRARVRDDVGGELADLMLRYVGPPAPR